jgi:hypothetical protein
MNEDMPLPPATEKGKTTTPFFHPNMSVSISNQITIWSKERKHIRIHALDSRNIRGER